MGNLWDNQNVALYNGVSSRSRGWKSRKPGYCDEGRVPAQLNVKRWDGAVGTCFPWDNLRKDPELWFRNGNCMVHLYGKGQSRRGPAFRLPISDLRAAGCQPLIERFIDRDVPESPESDPDHDGEDVIELYIPAPPMSNKEQALLYHLATRNFFAWIFRKSLVGDHLGHSIVALLDSIYEFRSPGSENQEELLEYLDGEGYLDMRCQPSHALAILHFSESFKLRELYTNAYAHCIGMSDRLFLSSEYEHISSASRKLIRRGRVEMDLRLSHAGAMLTTFLEEDLSEANLGLSAGARAHLDRFRSFLSAFYTRKFGYYPPPSVDAQSTIFEPKKYRIMRADFEALYEYLVDETFTTSQSSPFLAQGGICTLQSVHSFDLRHQFKSLDNPLPLLPELVPQPAPRNKRLSWLPKPDKLRPDKLRPDDRLVVHAALARSANTTKIELYNNDLLCAYRKFEEDCIFAPHKADRLEKVSQVDARKVRWIVIYATYQTLLSCTESPSEVETNDAPYHVAITTDNLPPWKEDHPIETLLRRQSSLVMDANPPSVSSSGWSTPLASTAEHSLDIQPDIDYFALTHRDEQLTPGPTRSLNSGLPAIPPRTMSLTRSLSRSKTIRRSLTILKNATSSHDEAPPIPPRRVSRPTHHEIVVQGYGNGTNQANVTAGDDVAAVMTGMPGSPPATTKRSSSTTSQSSQGSDSKSSSTNTGTNSDASERIPDTPITDYTMSLPGSRRGSAGNCEDSDGNVPSVRRASLAASSIYSTAEEAAGTSPKTTNLVIPAVPSLPPAVPLRNPTRMSFSAYSYDTSLRPNPLRVARRQSTIGIPSAFSTWHHSGSQPPDKSGRDTYQDFADSAYQRAVESVREVNPESEWEHFVGIGGHVAVSEASRRPP